MTAPKKRPQNKDLSLREYQNGEVSLRSLPQYVLVELTQGCNLKCPMCRQQIISTTSRSMSDALFDKVARELFPTADVVDLRGWGESLILPRIVEYIQKTVAYEAAVRFVTSLCFRRDSVLEALAKHQCIVGISVDTVDPSLYRILRGGGDFLILSSNIEKLVQHYRHHHGHTDDLHFTTVLQRPALASLPSVIDFAADKGITEVRLFSVTADHSSPLSIESYPDLVDRALERASVRARQRNVRLIAGTRLGSMPTKAGRQRSCIHPWMYAHIAFDGSVGFCDHLIGPEGQDYILGDLKRRPFGSIWNSARWQRLRKEHLGARRPAAANFAACAWCYQNRYIDFEGRFFEDLQADASVLA